ncbi:M61 glycyl aminopeptidase [bacterium BMS3Abin05]|nr:M61 glycyl aminopeptidase [bacterium BMS3Abin05]
MRKNVRFLFFGVILIFCTLAGSLSGEAKQVSIAYSIDMKNPDSHYFNVTMRVQNFQKKYVDFHMPVWIPGSYLVREFEKYVIGVKAFNGSGEMLPVRKVRKNIWRVRADKAKTIQFKYSVYAFTISIRNSFLDRSHAFINPSSIFMFIKELKEKPVRVKITPYPSWKTISTGLTASRKDPFTLTAKNYDQLVDSPIEIGSQKVLTFSVKGVPHEISIYGRGDYNPDSLIQKIQKIVRTEVGIMKDIDYSRYVFLIQFQPRGGGGLEHRNSCVLQMDHQALQSGKRLDRFIGLVAHEYFHNWNVKRLRPKALGPFDYDREDYSWLLWVAEGFTTYYGGRALLQAGFRTPKSAMNSIAGNARYLVSTPGNRVEPVDEASFDAWIKYYRPNENSINTTISYYSKGAVIATLLDLTIRHETQNRKSLDDLMRSLYQTYYKRLNRWYTEKEFEAACEKMAGISLKPFFRRYVSGTDSIDANHYLNYAGIELYKKDFTHEDSLKGYTGLRIVSKNGNAVVKTVLFGSPAFRAGIYTADEILAADDFRISAGDIAGRLQEKQPGKTVRLLISRRGIIQEIPLTLGLMPNTKFAVRRIKKPTALQKKIFESYFHTKWEEKVNPGADEKKCL